MEFTPKYRRYRRALGNNLPVEIDPSKARSVGAWGSALYDPAERAKAQWFDEFQTIDVAAAMNDRWIEVLTLADRVLPSWRGYVFQFFPWLSDAAGAVQTGPLITPATVNARWRVCSRGAPIPGWSLISTIAYGWGVVSPIPLIEWRAGDSLTVEAYLHDPAHHFNGGLFGARLAGRTVPR